jgi:hypothetical protein
LPPQPRASVQSVSRVRVQKIDTLNHNLSLNLLTSTSPLLTFQVPQTQRYHSYQAEQSRSTYSPLCLSGTMDHIASTLGLSLPLASARSAVMQETRIIRQAVSSSLIGDLCFDFKASSSRLDDDTASLSSYEDSLSFSNSVSFASPLVTGVFERPKTAEEEKHHLYYTEVEYREFRYDCMYGREPRERVVKFDSKIVSNVHTYSIPVSKDILFYSNSDLQQ